MTNHTPTPWKAYGRTVYADKSIVLLAVSEYDAERGPQYNLADGLKTDDEALLNAELIVRAVNSHQMLVDALKALIEDYEYAQHAAHKANVQWFGSSQSPAWAARQALNQAKP